MCYQSNRMQQYDFQFIAYFSIKLGIAKLLIYKFTQTDAKTHRMDPDIIEVQRLTGNLFQRSRDNQTRLWSELHRLENSTQGLHHEIFNQLRKLNQKMDGLTTQIGDLKSATQQNTRQIQDFRIGFQKHSQELESVKKSVQELKQMGKQSLELQKQSLQWQRQMKEQMGAIPKTLRSVKEELVKTIFDFGRQGRANMQRIEAELRYINRMLLEFTKQLSKLGEKTITLWENQARHEESHQQTKQLIIQVGESLNWLLNYVRQLNLNPLLEELNLVQDSLIDTIRLLTQKIDRLNGGDRRIKGLHL